MTRVKKRIGGLLIAMGALAGSTGYAQINCSGKLFGQVLGQITREPLTGATVYISELKTGAVADTVGSFRLSGLCPGRYTLTYQSVGHTPLTQYITIGVDSLLTLPPVLLAADNRLLQEVIVTEHRSEAQQLLQVQTSLSGTALEATRGQSLGESLKTITGLYSIQTGPTISKPVIHGLYSNRIITLNNGIRQEDQQWGTEHAPQVDQFLASRITVIKGAASIRYGSDAIGGVILIEPKAMPATPGIGGALNVVGATNGGMGVVSGMLEGAFKKYAGLSWRVQGTLNRSGYVKTPNYYLANTSYHETNFSGDLHYDHKRWNAEIFFSLFDTKVGLFTGAQVGSLADLYAAIQRPEPLVQPGFSYTLDRPYQSVQHGLLKLRAAYRTGRGGTITATLARQQNTRREYDRLSFSRVTDPELFLELATNTADLIWEHQSVKNAAGGIWSGSVGGSGMAQSNVRRFLFLIPNFQSYGGGVFAIERYALGNWTVEAGVRYDYRWLRAYFLDNATAQVYNQTKHWQNMNGSLGATYQFRPNLTLTGNLSTAWRAPNVADLYSDGLHQSAVAYERGNPNLQPEQAYNGNLVLAYSGSRFGGEVGLYNNRIDNFIYLKPDSVPIVRQRGAFPAYSYTQVRAIFRGVDASLTYKLTNRLTITSSNSLLYARNRTDGGFLVFVPPNRSDNRLRYNLEPVGKLTGLYVSVSGLYVAKQNRVPPATRQEQNGQIIFQGDFAPPPPAYFLLGAEAGFQVPMAGHLLSVILAGSNLANVAYRDYLNRFRYYADEPGRNLSLKLRLPFGTNN